MKTILLKVDNRGLTYNVDRYIFWQHTNLPKEAFSIRESEPVIWEVAMLNYQNETAELQVRVISYYAEMSPRVFASQQLKKPLRSLRFEPLNEHAFKSQLTYYNAQKLAPFLQKQEESETESLLNSRPLATDSVHSSFDLSGEPYILTGLKEGKWQEEFEVPLMSTEFQLGQIKAQVYVEAVNEPIDLILYNDTILPEFDHIKSFFAKALNTSVIHLRAEIEVKGGRIVRHQACSSEVDRINDKLIGVVRALRVRQLTRLPSVLPVNKELLTDEELFATFEEEMADLGNTYQEKADQEILADLLTIRDVRNRKQLLYLAGNLHDPSSKIRFTLAPLFGFIFTVKGETMRHYIWELLNSHATYIWSMDKEVETTAQQYQEIEKVIGLIRAQGRQHYRQHYHLVHDFEFNLISHQFARSPVKDHFPRWKHRLLEHLI